MSNTGRSSDILNTAGRLPVLALARGSTSGLNRSEKISEISIDETEKISDSRESKEPIQRATQTNKSNETHH